MRDVELLLGDRDVDPIGDRQRVVAGLGNVGEEFAHLLGRLDVELVGQELHPARVLDRLAGSDAEQDVVRLCVIPTQVVRIVGGHQRQVQLGG